VTPAEEWRLVDFVTRAADNPISFKRSDKAANTEAAT
jgi:hypothetical protein